MHTFTPIYMGHISEVNYSAERPDSQSGYDQRTQKQFLFTLAQHII